LNDVDKIVESISLECASCCWERNAGGKLCSIKILLFWAGDTGWHGLALYNECDMAVRFLLQTVKL